MGEPTEDEQLERGSESESVSDDSESCGPGEGITANWACSGSDSDGEDGSIAEDVGMDMGSEVLDRDRNEREIMGKMATERDAGCITFV